MSNLPLDSNKKEVEEKDLPTEKEIIESQIQEPSKANEGTNEHNTTLKPDTSNNISNSIQVSKNFFIPPSNKTPIEYVDYIERNYIYFFSEPTSDSFFQLSSYRQKNQIKCTILDFPENKEIDTLIYKKNNKISSVGMRFDNLFIGDDSGMIQLYSYKKKQRIKFFEHNEVKNEMVTSIDISKDGTLLVAGHNNGFISIWNIEDNKLIKIINDRHSCRVVAIKFIYNNPKKIILVSSDKQGQVQKIILEKKILKLYSITDDSIYKDKQCTYIVEIFNPESDKDLVIAAFGTANRIRIYQLEPSVCQICEFERPTSIENDTNIPDVGIGVGIEPSKDRGSLINIIDEDYLKEKVMLAISWDQIIKIYSFDINKEKIGVNNNNEDIYEYSINISNEGRPCGHFVNENTIIRLGFISSSLIFYFDQNKKIKIFNTAFTSYGDCKSTPNSKDLAESKRSLLEEGKCIDPKIMCDDISFKNSNLLSYRNYIICNNKNICLLCEKSFHKGKLLGYEESLNILKKENKYLDALCIGLDIYNGLLTSFPDIPTNEEKRKNDLVNYLGELLSDYIQNETKKEMARKQNSLSDEFIKCIRITIEFCLSIKAVDYLFQEVQDFFTGYSDDFFRNVEPFIFCDKLKLERIQEFTISSLIASYVSRNACHVLSHLITHLRFESINNELVKASCKKYNLFTAMIYIYSNGIDPNDYFTPIIQMYNYFINENNFKGLNDINYDSYNELIINKGIQFMTKTKDFIGHKLFWYIDLCLNGKKLCLSMEDSDSFKVKNNDYRDLIAMVYIWLLDEKVFEIFVKFDSFSFFNMLTKIFSSRILIDIIKNYDFENSIIKKFKEKNKIENINCKYNDMKEIIKEIINRSEKFQSIFISLDINMFIVRIATLKKNRNNNYLKDVNDISELLLVSKEDVFNSSKYILNYFISLSNKSESSTLIDKFKCHGINYNKDASYNNINQCSENVKSLSKQISDLLQNLLDSELKFTSEEYQALFDLCSKTHYFKVKIKLLELNNKYGEVLEEYIKNGKLIGDREVFNFINSKLSEIKNNPENFKKLKIGILQKIKILSELSMDKTIELIDKNFKNEPKDELINSFKDAYLLQYEYTTILINDSNNIYSKIDLNQDITYTVDNTFNCLSSKILSPTKNKIRYSFDDLRNEYTNIIKNYFSLLIKFNKINELILLLKKKIKYLDIDECINQCKDNNLLEPCIFLLCSIGHYGDALDLQINDMNNIFNNLYNSIGKENEESIINSSQLLTQSLSNAIKVCENSVNCNTDISVIEENQTSKAENVNHKKEDLWFKLLQAVYSMNDKLKEEKDINKINESSYVLLLKNASEYIEELLSKMCLYVPMEKIVEIITSSYQGAEVKEFKSLLIKISNSFNRYKITLTAAKTLIKSSFLRSNNNNKEKLKGNVLLFSSCDYCKKKFNNNEKIICFVCGHKIHFKCNQINLNNVEGEQVCIICTKNESDIEKTKKSKEDEKILKEKKKKLLESIKQNEFKELMYNKVKKMNKLRGLDKGYLERIVKFDETTDN